MSKHPANTGLVKIDAAFAAGIVAVTAAGYFIGIDPALRRQSTLVESRAQLVEVLQQAADAEREAEDLDKKLLKIDERLSKLSFKLEPVTVVNDRISRITNLAAEKRLDIAQMRSSDPETVGRFVAVPIRMAGSGSFAGCVEFISQLSQMQRDTAVTGFKLTAQESQTGSAVSFSFDLAWYAAPNASAGISDPK